MRPPCSRERSAAVPALIAAALGLAAVAPAGCAAGGGPDARTAGVDAAPASDPCAEGCVLRVENRLPDTRIAVSLSHMRGGEILGRVEANRSETFEIDEYDGHRLDVWVWDDRTGERIGLFRVHQFPGGAGRVVVSSR